MYSTKEGNITNDQADALARPYAEVAPPAYDNIYNREHQDVIEKILRENCMPWQADSPATAYNVRCAFSLGAQMQRDNVDMPWHRAIMENTKGAGFMGNSKATQGADEDVELLNERIEELERDLSDAESRIEELEEEAVDLDELRNLLDTLDNAYSAADDAQMYARDARDAIDEAIESLREMVSY